MQVSVEPGVDMVGIPGDAGHTCSLAELGSLPEAPFLSQTKPTCSLEGRGSRQGGWAHARCVLGELCMGLWAPVLMDSLTPHSEQEDRDPWLSRLQPVAQSAGGLAQSASLPSVPSRTWGGVHGQPGERLKVAPRGRASGPRKPNFRSK